MGVMGLLMNIKQRNDLVVKSLGTIYNEVYRFVGQYGLRRFMSQEEVEDMRSSCVLHMIPVIGKFNINKNAKLKTYVCTRSKWFLLDYIKKEWKIKKLETDYAVEKVASKVNEVFILSEKQAEKMFSSYSLTSDNVKELYAQMCDVGLFPNQELFNAMNKLSNKRIYVLLSFYVLNKSVKEISNQLGLSETSGWVYRMRKYCIEHLQEQLDNL